MQSSFFQSINQDYFQVSQYTLLLELCIADMKYAIDGTPDASQIHKTGLFHHFPLELFTTIRAGVEKYPTCADWG